jgi:hypothetical protein
MKKRRYLGTSHLFNVGSNQDFRNGLDIQFDDDSVSVEINSLIEPDRKVQVVGSAADARVYRQLLLKMERESLRARRQAGEFSFFKPKRRKARLPVPVCDSCGGRGGNEDDDGNWVECKTCRM